MPQGLEKIRVGVVGLGPFGSHHARHYAADPRARLVAVADVDLSRACGAGESFGAEAVSNHRGLIGKVDAVSIAVPTASHYAVACDFIDAGVHVFIEKPIAASAAEAADLVERATARRTMLQIGHIERFSPAFRALKERMGDPRLIAAVRRTPWTGRALDVDVVLDLMIHDIDLAIDLAGAPVVAIDAVGMPVFAATNDIAEARLIFANGVVATLAASRVAAKAERSLSVAERGRALVADLAAPSLTILSRANTRSDVAPESIGTEVIALAKSDNLAAEIGAFLDSIRTGTPPLVDGRAGLEAVKVADMILAAIATPRGRPPARDPGNSFQNGASR